MFGIGMPELILIAVVALIVLGPKKLPDLAQSLGRAVREFRKATSELKESLQVDSGVEEVKKAFTEFHHDVNAAVRTPEEAPAAAEAAPAKESAQAEEAALPPTPTPSPEDPTAAEKVAALEQAYASWKAGQEGAAAPAAAEPAPSPDAPADAGGPPPSR